MRDYLSYRSLLGWNLHNGGPNNGLYHVFRHRLILLFRRDVWNMRTPVTDCHSPGVMAIKLLALTRPHDDQIYSSRMKDKLDCRRNVGHASDRRAASCRQPSDSGWIQQRHVADRTCAGLLSDNGHSCRYSEIAFPSTVNRCLAARMVLMLSTRRR
jgi:hypothetical protein